MSEMERNKGKLYPLNKTLAEVAEEVVKELPDYYTDKVEYLLENAEDYDIFIVNEKAYRVEFEEKRNTGSDEFCDVEHHEDGTISFHTFHYNGGGHWTELVSDKI